METLLCRMEAELFLEPNRTQLSDTCVHGTRQAFDLCRTTLTRAGTPAGPLHSLFTGGLDHEQVWEQIELLNAPALRYLRGVVGRVHRLKQEESEAAVDNEHKLLEREEEEEEEEGEGGEEEEEGEGGEEEEEEEGEGGEEEEEGEGGEEEEDEGECGREEAESAGSRGVEDQFFKLCEMEAFLAEEERRDQDSSSASSSEAVDLFQDVPLDNLFYQDFFDPPSRGGEDGGGASSEGEGVSSEGECEDSGGGSGEGEQVGCEGGDLSLFEKKQVKLSSAIARLEAENAGGRPWQLGGEAAAPARPLNSLLEEDLAFERAALAPPTVTQETTRTLEELIRQRIADESWDDVQRKVKPREKPYQPSASQPLDQEKSKLSLAQVYEQEYTQQMMKEKSCTDEEDPAHKEIRELMDKLFVKLDALSNFHFTPKPVKPEVRVVVNVPALCLEEAVPVTASDATLLAPSEVQAKPPTQEKGENEMTQSDKHRERRKAKRRRKLKHIQHKVK